MWTKNTERAFGLDIRIKHLSLLANDHGIPIIYISPFVFHSGSVGYCFGRWQWVGLATPHQGRSGKEI